MTRFDDMDNKLDDSDDVDEELSAHLRRTLVAVAGTIHEDEPVADVVPLPSRRRRPRMRTLAALAGAVAAASVALAGLVVVRPSGSDDRQAWASELIEVARAAPRLMLTADGWMATRVDEFDVGHGEITWTEGDPTAVPSTTVTTLDENGEPVVLESGPVETLPEITIRWTADDNEGGHPTYDEALADLTSRAQRLPDITIAGHRAALFQTDPSPVYVAIWKDGDYGVGVGGNVDTLDEFRTVAGSIEAVDVDTWLSALPDESVLPAERADTVDEMLADIPLPTGFDRTSLADGGPMEPYHLGARVTSAVACAWFDRWKAATGAGDTAAAAEAVEAMGTSPDWAVLRQMEAQGGWSDAVWELADAMAEGDTIDNGAGPVLRADFAAAAVCD